MFGLIIALALVEDLRNLQRDADVIRADDPLRADLLRLPCPWLVRHELARAEAHVADMKRWAAAAMTWDAQAWWADEVAQAESAYNLWHTLHQIHTHQHDYRECNLGYLKWRLGDLRWSTGLMPPAIPPHQAAWSGR